MITHEWVLENFEYRSDGLYWKIGGASKRKVGTRAGGLRPDGYRQIGITINKVDYRYLEHRLCYFYMTGRWPKELIDHRDGNKNNNAWSNLRDATQSENAMNKNSLGVYWDNSLQRWVAQIKKDRKNKYLGCFHTKKEALAVRRAAELEHFGEFAPIK